MCKFYQGAEDKELEKHLKTMFRSVHREKPESSRSVGSSVKVFSITDCIKESKEAYFVALRRKAHLDPNLAEAVDY